MKTYKWKLKLFRTAVVLVGAFACGSVSAQTISGTPHDLSGASTNTDQVCVFCHTPHGGDNTAAVPLWNRTLDGTPATTYTTYDSLGTSSRDGTTATVGSVSIACLSCHDGAQARDTLINYPGSGSTPWTGDAALAAMAPANLVNDLALIGTDLTDDHPVGIQYAGGGFIVGGGAKVDADFKDPNSAVINGQTIWWVETNASGSRDKGDMALYTRDLGGATGPEPFVECASCHDPHNNANTTFLRTSNAGSAVCLACHTK